MSDKTEKDTIGVILLNLGGPDSLEAVKDFLNNLFSDRQIIQLGPSFFQKPLAYLISNLRSKKTEKMYSLIGGKSPILEITIAQAKALEKLLNGQTDSPSYRLHSSQTFKVYVGMRYWHPLIEEVSQAILEDGIRKLIALSLYPHYSITTSGSSFLKLKQVAADYPIKIFFASSWFNHPLYIEALVDVIKRGMESFKIKSEMDIHVLFSAHSLPQRIIDEGDPYVNQIMGTIEEITKNISLEWHLSYQSKSGPVKWLEPSTEKKLEELAARGIKNVLIVPVSFVSDHIETLYEIDILYKNLAEKLGITLKRVDSLNIHPVFIGALKDVVMRSVKEAGWD